MKRVLPKNSRYKNGIFAASKKYSSNDPCIFRSHLELRVFQSIDNDDKYTSWEAEPNLGIKYHFDGKERTYYVDVIATHKDKGVRLIEIKPYQQTQLPKYKHGTNKKNYEYQIRQYYQNIAKWRAAKAWAIERGYTFMIITEKYFR